MVMQQVVGADTKKQYTMPYIRQRVPTAEIDKLCQRLLKAPYVPEAGKHVKVIVRDIVEGVADCVDRLIDPLYRWYESWKAKKNAFTGTPSFELINVVQLSGIPHLEPTTVSDTQDQPMYAHARSTSEDIAIIENA